MPGCCRPCRTSSATRPPRTPSDTDFVYRQAIRAKAFDSLRGILPAASLSNVGIYGTGQGYEHLLLRMRAHPLPEAQAYADLMLTELRKVIPSFLRRVDLPDRGGAWSDYLADTHDAMAEVAEQLVGSGADEPSGPAVDLVDFDPDAEVKLVATMLYAHTDLPERVLEERVRAMTVDERLQVMRAYVGDRANRRHKPGRALERPFYRFDVLADYGAFRDLQRHRMLTIEWQSLSPHHGYTRPEAVERGRLPAPPSTRPWNARPTLHDDLLEDFPDQAPYAVALAYRIRFNMQLNAREAMHMLELRTTPQGHPAYRVVAQEMHTLIAEQAGHRAIAEMMRHVDHTAEPGSSVSTPSAGPRPAGRPTERPVDTVRPWCRTGDRTAYAPPRSTGPPSTQTHGSEGHEWLTTR